MQPNTVAYKGDGLKSKHKKLNNTKYKKNNVFSIALHKG